MNCFRFVYVTLSMIVFAVILGLTGCAETAKRQYLAGPPNIPNCNNVPKNVSDGTSTPEISENPSYTLHFLEFDDQGWPYADASANEKAWKPNRQIDCAIADLVEKLKDKGHVRAFVFVHGWHHTAKSDDRDVDNFRKFLAMQATTTKRKVVGFYIGWEGETFNAPLLKDITFWGRKNAAHHVSEGSVREFFSRVKALRDHYNRPRNEGAKRCGKEDSWLDDQGCPLRMVMIGHSFGAWILYSSTAPYVMETLAGLSDIPESEHAVPRKTERERGIADMIILLNPAFEASRYVPVYHAAQRYRPQAYETPLLISVTSTADGATKDMFPIARFFNTIFQYPATSDEESVAMKRTHGHIEQYLTHDLTLTGKWDDKTLATCDQQRQVLREKFFGPDDQPTHLSKNWVRNMCGGLQLTNLANPDFNQYNVVWNIRTHSNVIADHNAITGPELLEFFFELYGDMERLGHRVEAEGK